jgi:hypothetical protein
MGNNVLIEFDTDNNNKLYIKKSKEIETNLTRDLAESSAASQIDIANYQSKMLIEKTKIMSIKHIFKSLKIVSANDKQQLDYMLNLLKNENLHLRIGYQPLLVNTISSNLNSNLNVNTNVNSQQITG